MHIDNNQKRREFVLNLARMVGSGMILSAPFAANAEKNYIDTKAWTVGEIMDLFIKEVPGGPFEKTVDTLKSGSRDNQVSGIVTTMFATIPVIRKAIEAKADFIIAHEPTFYNHLDDTGWLENDEVYKYKAALLKDNNITVWRNHDYVHRHNPDGVLFGVLNKLGWKQYSNAEMPHVVKLPATSLNALIDHLKQKAGILKLRYVGDLKQSCSNILLMPGAAGGRAQIEAIGKHKPDVIVVGEVQEWETAEYIRDARASGKNISLVVLGHSDSEEPGSAYMAGWLKKNVAGVKVIQIPAGNPFTFA